MDPISAMIGIAGLGLQLYGAERASSAAREATAAQTQQIGFEMQAENVRSQTMEMEARRNKLQNLRNAQQASALALNNATSQGVTAGSSALGGGQGQIRSAAETAEVGINQQLYSGRAMFGINLGIDRTKIDVLNAQQKQQEGQAFSSMGGSLISAMTPLRQLMGPTGRSPGGGASFGGGGE